MVGAKWQPGFVSLKRSPCDFQRRSRFFIRYSKLCARKLQPLAKSPVPFIGSSPLLVPLWRSHVSGYSRFDDLRSRPAIAELY
jgi:hypothetical protein